ncbi:hypothetical protein ABVK25_005238 [Lepraria finkii]|uniref:Uncharacterized protein n=1 Tax=Lepraria finkii TaxID=1340010 RepID=A0ABR4B9R5_9LECA
MPRIYESPRLTANALSSLSKSSETKNKKSAVDKWVDKRETHEELAVGGRSSRSYQQTEREVKKNQRKAEYGGK